MINASENNYLMTVKSISSYNEKQQISLPIYSFRKSTKNFIKYKALLNLLTLKGLLHKYNEDRVWYSGMSDISLHKVGATGLRLLTNHTTNRKSAHQGFSFYSRLLREYFSKNIF